MPARRSHPGYLLSLAGGIGLAVDLFQPWYSFRIPGAAIDQADALAGRFGQFGGLIHQGVQIVAHTNFKLSAWQAFKVIQVVLLIWAVVAVCLSVLSLLDQAQGVNRWITHAGTVACALIVFRMVVRPGPTLAGTPLLHLEPGAWLGLLAAAAILAGGLIESVASGPRARIKAPVPAPGWQARAAAGGSASAVPAAGAPAAGAPAAGAPAASAGASGTEAAGGWLYGRQLS